MSPLLARRIRVRKGASSYYTVQTYKTLAILPQLALARAAVAAAIPEKPAGRFMISSRIRVVKRHPEGDW